MKYVYLVHWIILHGSVAPYQQEKMEQTFQIRDSAIAFYKRAEVDAKNLYTHQSEMGYGKFKCCRMDSLKVK